ncbi:MAG TPA: right-handed parallel beta-helix repeat-containing protein, partial [Pyrinomonadaceae bacterium]|nr:right-handed parallel beta-helix repeat-containing protein [Pyrinomonadaceae bacterium]
MKYEGSGNNKGCGYFLLSVIALSHLLGLVTVPQSARAQMNEILEVRVSSGSDDAEEQSGSTSLTSSDLELTVSGGFNQTVGMRFNNVTIPNGATIANAYVQFKVDEVSSTVTSLTIAGEDADDAPALARASGNISSRPKTSVSVAWTPSPWTMVGEADLAERTPDIAAVIQEIVDRSGWNSGYSLVLIVSGDGNGKRVAESFNGDQAGAPLLHIEYSFTPNPGKPQVNAGTDQSITLPTDAVCLTGTASDDGLPNPLTFRWTQKDGSPGVTFTDSSALSTTAIFPGPGTYTLGLTADDGALAASDDVMITVSQTIHVPDDAPTIQAAINLANSSDTVLVAPGTYVENLILAESITLASHYLTTRDPSFIGQTVIDGSGGASVIEVADSVGTGTSIIGFTIQNGHDGIKARKAFNLLHNRIVNTGDGVDYAHAGKGSVIRSNTFENNSDDGVDLDGASESLIEDNIIRNNGDDGIEVRLHNYVGPTLEIIIRENIISNNQEDGIQLIDYPGLSSRVFHIDKNLIQGNTDVGLGLMSNGNTVENFEGASIPEPIHLTNNTFANNNHGITGGDNMVARNNIIIGSTLGLKNVDASSSVSHTLFWDNATDFETSNVDALST